MKPARIRTQSDLRRQILLSVAWRSTTLLPLVIGIGGGLWLAVLGLSIKAASFIGASGLVALFGGLYQLTRNGIAIRDGVLARWEREADQEENLTKQVLRTELLTTPGAADVLELYDRIEAMYGHAESLLVSTEVSLSNREHFLPLLEQNYDNAVTLINRLAYMQKRIWNLQDVRRRQGRHVFEEKMGQLEGQRQAIMSHVVDILSAMERVATEVPKYSEADFERSRRDLDELERSLDVARASYTRLREEIHPVSSVCRVPVELRARGIGSSMDRN